jgi:hypothetical protein
MRAGLAEAYPDLAHLLGAYLHQDFSLLGPTLADAVAAFARDEEPTVVAAARHDIARFARAHAHGCEAALRRLEPGLARPPGMPAGELLAWLDAQLARAAGAP